MLLFWKIRFLDRNARQFKDRHLYLDTETLEAALKAAVELVAEALTRNGREILKYRNLFIEHDAESLPHDMSEVGDSVIGVGPMQYFEDEEGREITLDEIARVCTGNANAIAIPAGARQHDIDFMLAERRPIPVASVNLPPEHCAVLGYFIRDVRELCESAFMHDEPGTIRKQGDSDWRLETAATDTEIRSFVTIFRRLYMEKETANFLKAAGVFSSAMGEDRYAKWVAGVADTYKKALEATPDLRPFVAKGKCSFNKKRLIDVFLYTQFAHQPCARRQRQYRECLDEMGQNADLLTWMFLTEIWKTSQDISGESESTCYRPMEPGRTS